MDLRCGGVDINDIIPSSLGIRRDHAEVFKTVNPFLIASFTRWSELILLISAIPSQTIPTTNGTGEFIKSIMSRGKSGKKEKGHS
mmetsp:Transcript_40354/g.47221  ORF Transcript_40354/g.47221 Transcript_40354/m.47221 type:complete len:85 (-) Transcript_40354:460-714(-)